MQNTDCTSLCCLQKIYHPFARGKCEDKLIPGLKCIPEYIRNKDQTILIVNPKCDIVAPETTVSPITDVTSTILPTTPCPISKRPLVVNLSISIPLPTQTITETKPLHHIPVLEKETLNILQPQDNQIFIDMTYGAGGHTQSILDSAKNIKIYALDRDPLAHDAARRMAQNYPDQVIPLLGRFSELGNLLHELEVPENSVDGILFDLGCSSMQFDDPSRGFGLSKDGPLDMRMDGKRYPDQPTAADVIRTLDEDDLYKIMKVYGEEKAARPIAQALVESRYSFCSITTTNELAQVVASVLAKDSVLDKLERPAHSATKTFQAFRIFVNNELNELHRGLQLANRYLKYGGRAVVISFHSLEDRIAKRHFMEIDFNEPFNMTMSQKYRSCTKWHTNKELDEVLNDKIWSVINKKVIVPSEEEVKMNPRSRSAKLRAANKQKIAATA
uniref:Methyltransferase domain-containing protein n=1 Tax=Strigamia maritima TaxID=126957 RepID=T1J7Z4_STRMM